MDQPTLAAIDPKGCGCTECLTGEYKPIDNATRDDILALLEGDLRNNTNGGFTVAFSPGKVEIIPVEMVFERWEFDHFEDDLGDIDPTDVINRLVYGRSVY